MTVTQDAECDELSCDGADVLILSDTPTCRCCPRRDLLANGRDIARFLRQRQWPAEQVRTVGGWSLDEALVAAAG